MKRYALLLGIGLAAACNNAPSQAEDDAGAGGTAWSTSPATTSGSVSSSTASSSVATTSSSAASTGAGGDPVASLDALLSALRADPEAALLDQSRAQGWPAPVDGGFLYVSHSADNGGLDQVAGDHDAWAGTAMTADDGFHWLVIDAPAGSRYKFTNGTDWLADPWSRAYAWDENGLMSERAPSAAHLERHFAVSAAGLAPRTVRVWVPDGAVTHQLFVHDGQNLFSPYALWGGWNLDESAPAGMMLVGIDNTAARMDEYTHVSDDIGGGTIAGGLADSYTDFVVDQVHPLIDSHYGAAPKRGVLGSSLGGLVSMHAGLRHDGVYDFVGCMSGTLGWGSLGAHVDTLIERYAAAAKPSATIYLDSGGSGTCFDGDGDGIDDDGSGSDNMCVTQQMHATLLGLGYQNGVDVHHFWDDGAPHNEVAWGMRVWRPLEVFAGL